MFLEKLCEYAQQIALPPPMYQSTPVRYIIILDTKGIFRGINENTDTQNKRGIPLIAPHLKRASAIKPKLLVDNAEYTLGLTREKSDPGRVRAQHQAYVAQIQECAEITQEPTVRAVAHFLESLDIDCIMKEKPDLDAADNVTFKVGDVYPFEQEPVKTYWSKKAVASDSEQAMQCLVCGEMRPPVERLPIVIKGIPGGQSTGLTLISANAAAFESYGLNASLIAPTCETCGEKFGNALNQLLRQDNTHIVIPPLAYIFWVRDPTANMNLPLLMRADSDEVKKLLQSTWSGNAASTQLASTSFYAATLSASGARVVLRDWLETSLDTVQKNLQRFFRLQSLQDISGEPRFFSLQSLINATLNRDTQEVPVAQVGQALLRVALYGGQLPPTLLYKTVRRIRASRKVQPEQAALIKLVLLSQQNPLITNQEGDYDMRTVNEGCKNAAYLCGRLLAQLDYIQYQALGKVNATIVDRFYGTASTKPAVVFPTLIRGAQSHMKTIRQNRNPPGKDYMDYVDKDLANLLEDLPAFPSTLTLSEQSMFVLGFYHQKTQFLSRRHKDPGDQTQNDSSTDREESGGLPPSEKIEEKYV
jgi:CRISPR-associated protein Csd1